MKKYIAACMAVTVFGLSSVVFAEIAVIVNPAAGIDSMTEEDIARLYLGKTKSFPNGNSAMAVNQNEGSPVRDKFNESICKKSASQYKAYWSQLVFTGKGTPPKEAGNDAAVKAMVASTSNAIGYVDASAVDSSVKVVFKLP